MKLMSLFLFLVLQNAYGRVAEFPTGPNLSTTPGSLCGNPDSYRYQERIPYCLRDVSTQVKAQIFEDYRNLGYGLNPSHRADYKIDHFIPLCAGGSNEEKNLWPQHLSVYNLTDPLEGVGCEKLKDGKIRHAALVNLIVSAKLDLRKVPKTLQYLQSL
ncbi:MAG TPA: hypothetical protein VNJ01_17695 [Bacteriovoracaceae bacterium]|nr:hypothetical protein [Bacteriovoracaceae bacterium]